jgi:hypothetical protein
MVNPASNLVPERAVHQPPPDPFQWPQGSERGDDMVEQARERAREDPSSTGDGGASPAPSASSASDGDAGEMAAPASSDAPSTPAREKDARPPSTVTAVSADADARRGVPLHVKGEIRADGEPCSHVVVELFFRDERDPKKLLLLGTTATNDDGAFDSAIVVPGTTPLGDYDVFVRTPGDARCGRGSN